MNLKLTFQITGHKEKENINKAMIKNIGLILEVSNESIVDWIVRFIGGNGYYL